MSGQRQQPTITLLGDPDVTTLQHEHPVVVKEEIVPKKVAVVEHNPEKVVISEKAVIEEVKVDERQQALLDEYFQRVKAARKSSKEGKYLEQMVEHSISLGLRAGMISIQEQAEDLDQIMMQSRIKAEEEKIDGYQAHRKVIQAELQFLDSQLRASSRSKSKQGRRSAESQSKRLHTAVLSKRQHQQFLQRLKKEKAELQQKKKQLEQTQRIKQQQQILKQEIQQAQRANREKEEKRKKLKEKIQEQKIMKEKKIKQEEENNLRLLEVKQKKRLHEVIQHKYQTEVLFPSLEEKKKKLKSIREQSKAFNISDLAVHQQEYLKKRQQSLEESIARMKHEQWHYKKPDKSDRLIKMLQEQKLKAKAEQQQKKKQLQEKIRKRDEFIASMKQRKPPTIDPKKREQMQKLKKSRLPSEQKDEKPDRKTLGINYLEQVKKMRKKTTNSHLQFRKKQLQQEEQSRSSKKAITNYLQTKRSSSQYNQLRERRIDRLVHSGSTDKTDKIRQLQLQANKFSQQQHRMEERRRLVRRKKNKSFDQEQAESVGLLLASIKAKMGIIDVFSQN